MILTKELLEQYYEMSDEQIVEEVERLKEAAQGETIFVAKRYHELEESIKVATLCAFASISYYYGCYPEGPVIYYKGPFIRKAM